MAPPRTKRDRWLLPLGPAIGASLGTGISQYMRYGGLPWLDAGFLGVTFITTYAVVFALDRLLFGSVKPTPREDTSDDDV